MYLLIPAVAKRLGYSPNTLRRWVRDGLIRTYRPTPNSQPRVKPSELETLMKDDRTFIPPGADLDTVWAAICAKSGLPDRISRTCSTGRISMGRCRLGGGEAA